MHELENKIAVITGGGSGIGAAMARRFAAEGMHVLLGDIDLANAEKVAAELRGTGARASAHRVEVGNIESVAAFADAARAFGGCHLLCANVGVNYLSRASELTRKDWEWLIRVNLLGTVDTVDCMLPLMRAAKGEKHIVVTSSVCGLHAVPNLAPYTATKFAVSGYAEVLRMELAPEAIGVTVVYPGVVNTTHPQSSAAARPREYGAGRETDAEAQEQTLKVLLSDPGKMVEADHATRHIVAAVRENRPFLVTHGGNQGPIAERLEQLAAAVAAADA